MGESTGELALSLLSCEVPGQGGGVREDNPMFSSGNTTHGHRSDWTIPKSTLSTKDWDT